MHRLITFARDNSAPVRTNPSRRRPTIDGLETRRYFASVCSSARLAAPVALSTSFTPTVADSAILTALATA